MASILLRLLDEGDATQGQSDSLFRELRNGASFARGKQQRLRQVLENRVITTPHVLVEVFRLREASQLNKRRADLRSCCLDLLAAGTILEEPCPAYNLYRDSRFRDFACRFGITDAGLLYTASQRKAVLLTDDRRLFAGVGFGLGCEIQLLDDYLLV
jgi:hypothetical protein